MAGLIGVREVTSSVFLPADQAPVSELPQRLKTLKEFVADPTAMDCRNFTEKMRLWQEKELYKHFAPTWEQFCSDNFSQPLEWIEHVMVGVELLDGKHGVVTVQQAYDAGLRAKILAETVKPLGEHGTNQYDKKTGDYHDNLLDRRTSSKYLAETVKPLGEHRRPTKEEEANKVDNCNLKHQGTSSKYLTARIARDHPDIHEKMKRGEFRSVRAAAIEAGIVKPAKQVSLKADTPESLLADMRRKLPPGFLESLANLLQG